MKSNFFALSFLFLLPTLSAASEVFDGYETYYATLPGQLFKSEGQELEQYFFEGEDEATRLGWSGTAAGRQHTVALHNSVITIDKRTLKPATIHMFPGESFGETDLGRGTTIYFANGWACLENTPATASGTAVRHQQVYLIKLAKTKPSAWKLPTLFAACAGIRLHENLIEFDQIKYRYRADEDLPSGVVLTTYAIRNDKFAPTGHNRSASFVEPDNVYKFRLD
jgi:hypothetical protein